MSADAPIVATTPALAAVSDLKVQDGQFIDDITNQNTAVIGHQLSIDLFGTDQSIGQLFKVRGQQFTVIGVLKTVDDAINYNNLNVNDAVIISLDSGKSFNQGIAQIRQINVKPYDFVIRINRFKRRIRRFGGETNGLGCGSGKAKTCD